MKIHFLRFLFLTALLITATLSIAQSSSTDYFRSVSTGNWSTASTWESSTDGVTNWIAATLTPTSDANTITIRNGHTVTITNSTTIDQAIVANGGILELATGATTSLTINDGTGNDLVIQSGGIFKHNIIGTSSPLPSFITNATMEVQDGGMLEVDNNNGSPSGYAVTNSAIASHIIWNDNAVFNWNTTTTNMTDGVTYFTATSAIPVFRFSAAASFGNSAPTVINAVLEANASVTFQNVGTKTIRNGIIGTGTVAATSASVGQFIINGSTAKLGGGTLTLPDAGLIINAGTEVTLVSNKKINKVGTATSAINLSGTLLAGDYIIDGTGTMQINGTVKTSNAYGLTGSTNTTFANGFGLTAFGGSSVIEYNRAGDQIITPLYYANLNISGSGIKKAGTGNDISLIGVLDIAANNTLLLNGVNDLNPTNTSTITINANATFDNGGDSRIKGAKSVSIYGTFITRSSAGFTGSSLTAIATTTTNVYIDSLSVVVYGRAGDQTVNTRTDYTNITFSGSGIKTVPSITPNGTVTVKDNAVVDAYNKTFGGTATNLTMLGGRFKVAGLATKPDIAGTYNLTGGVIEFYGGSTSSRQNIRSTPVYLNIEVTGINVGNSNSTTKLADGGTFTVKTGGSYENSGDKIDGSTGTQTFTMEAGSIFKTGVAGGFSGSLTAALYNIENITVDPKSTIIYSKAGDQTITTISSGYPTLLLKGSGIKTVTSGTVTIAATADSVVIDPLVVLKVSSAGKINFNNRAVTIHSNSNATGAIGEITSGSSALLNATNVTYERFIPAKRAFRFLASPVTTTTTIKANWMEGQNNPPPAYSVNNNLFPGYGTHITGSANAADGFDATATNNPSLFTFNNVTQSWTAVPNTSGTLVPGIGYRLLVRGSRSVDLSNNAATASNTILRTTGALQAGTIIYNQTSNPSINGTLNYYSVVGNPYASPVDWDALPKLGLSIYYTVWDPNLNTRGAYATYGNAITNPAGSSVNQNIQSGQSFFVQAKAANPSLTFNETNKTSINRNVFKTSSSFSSLTIQLLTDTTGEANTTADGVNVLFDENFSEAIDGEDAGKLVNLDESMSILRNGTSLSIEGRPAITSVDSIQLQIIQYRQKNYFLKIKADKMDDQISVRIKDNYLHNETAIDLSAINMLNFSITDDSASFSPNRFLVILTPGRALPVTIVNAKAAMKNKAIQVQWNIENELEIERYEIEKFKENSQFIMAAIVAAKPNRSLGESYNWLDNNVNFGSNLYRIKCITRNGKFVYSNQMLVNGIEADSKISISPNPVRGKVMHLLLTNLEKSSYTLSIFNAAGQRIHSQTIIYGGSAEALTVKLDNAVTTGLYTLQLNNNKETFSSSFLIE